MISTLPPRFRRRKAFDALGRTVAVLAVMLALIPLGAMIFYVLQQGAGSLNLNFFTADALGLGQPGGGYHAMIIGTLLLIGVSSVIGIPIGLLSGIHLAGRGQTRFAQTVRFVTDVVAGTPSIIAGILAFALIVEATGSFSALAGGVALALLMFPTVTRATEAAIAAVPSEIREASLALGASEWKTMLRVILPAAASGVVTAIILGVARVAGETAPLVFTVGYSQFTSTNIFGQIGTMPVQIWDQAQSAYPNDIHQAWAGAFVLFMLILVLNLLARLLTYRLTRRVQNA
ncbi:MAG TPA: phosphate ABC transporter permease PstA [Chloroflexota bacterium]|nr:phosphate ABC transporter permease PstA [Chloroflexota bacterium]